jgi:hypothetical protein
LDALCEGREDAVKKSEKIALWKLLDEILPSNDSFENSNDSIGLVFLIDRAYTKAYKLHKVYSSAMRIHYVARWINRLKSALGKDKNYGWKQILESMVNSEPGNYHLDNDRIIVTNDAEKKKKEVEYKITSVRTSKRETANTSLFW